MSVLFHAPLFGIFEVEENSEEDLAALTKGSKLFIYGIALAAGTGIYAGLSALFGAGLSGFPSFDMVEIQRKDYLLMILYILCGPNCSTRCPDPERGRTGRSTGKPESTGTYPKHENGGVPD